jgi:Cu(I)/Ag(I) efflux system membrane fusion protein
MKTARILSGTLLGVALLGAGYWAGARRSAGPASLVRVARYRCAMHPRVVSDKPGTCPICGMNLVPIEPPSAPSQPSLVPGRAAVALTPERRHLLGVKSEPVRRGRIQRELRTVGRVAVDERRVHHVHTKYEGYVEHLHVDFTGKYVQKGEPLLSIYSPDLVATQQEYLLALRAQQELQQGGSPGVAQGGRGLLEAARQRLLFWDIRPEEIERIEKTGQVMRTLDLHAELSGYVFQKQAFHGMRVTPMDTLFDMADLSRVWVLADVYESDLPQVRLGMSAELSVPYVPARRWSGPVTYIAPTVEEKTRTIKVRVEVDNAGQQLKPDMFADVFLKPDLGLGLLVAESAVIDAGDRKLVFLDRGEGRYEPREVRIGAKLALGFQVLSGLAEGELVVTSANFLLDSESSLKAAIAAMVSPAPAAEHRH